MSALLRGIAAGRGANKLGGGCLSIVGDTPRAAEARAVQQDTTSDQAIGVTTINMPKRLQAAVVLIAVLLIALLGCSSTGSPLDGTQ